MPKAYKITKHKKGYSIELLGFGTLYLRFITGKSVDSEKYAMADLFSAALHTIAVREKICGEIFVITTYYLLYLNLSIRILKNISIIRTGAHIISAGACLNIYILFLTRL